LAFGIPRAPGIGNRSRTVPARVVVPRDRIEVRGQLPVVEARVRSHQVRRDRQLGSRSLQGGDFRAHEVHGLVGDEPAPVEVQPMHEVLAVRHRGVNLRPCGERVAPERHPPRAVESLQVIPVPAPQPATERLLAQVAVALSAVLVGQVPGEHARVPAEPVGEPAVHLTNLLPIDGRSEAVIVPDPKEVTTAIRAHAQHLGVLLRHPGGPGARGRGEHGEDAGRGEPVDDAVEPGELVPPVLGLQGGPREDSHAHGVAPRQPHQPHVLPEHRRIVQPLVGVVVPAVPQPGQLRADRSTVPHRLPPSTCSL
jgi:hypothetical protein